MTLQLRRWIPTCLSLIVLLITSATAQTQFPLTCGRCNDSLTPWTYGTGTVLLGGPPECLAEYAYRYRRTWCGTQDAEILSYRLLSPDGPCLARPFNPDGDLHLIRRDLLRHDPMGFVPKDSGCSTTGFFGPPCFTYGPYVARDTVPYDTVLCRDTILWYYTVDTVVQNGTVRYDTTFHQDTVTQCDTLHKEWVTADTTIRYAPCPTFGCCAIVYTICSDGHGHTVARQNPPTIFPGDTCSGACKRTCMTNDSIVISSRAGRNDPPELSTIVPRPAPRGSGPGQAPGAAARRRRVEALAPAYDPQR